MTALIEARKTLLAAAARGNDNPQGYAAWYELIHDMPAPAHIMGFVETIYAAKREDKGALIFAFRGSWKTDAITILFTAFQIGHHPERKNLIVCVNDEAATNITGAIAELIDRHPVWKATFPHVVPARKVARDSRWGANGYDVIQLYDYVEDEETDQSYLVPLKEGEWTRRTGTEKDPSLLGLGYKSGSLIGKHPDGVLAVDDIHNEENTDSDRELTVVLKIVQDTLFPTMVVDPTKPKGERLLSTNVWVGTPWKEDDAYNMVRETGEFYFSRVPAMSRVTEAQSDEDNVVYFDHDELQGWWRLNWPDRFDHDTAISWYNKVGKRGFWRMFLLDLTGASEFGIRYFAYPHEDIDLSWPVVGGVDYASIMEESQRNSRDRSYFAMFYGAKLPQGGIVIIDGVVERIQQDEAERIMMTAQNLFPGYLYTIFEADGKGEEALAVFRRNPRLRILPLKTEGKSKKIRTERILSPWITNGTIKISDQRTPALNMLRKSLEDYPTGLSDPLDALFWVMQGAQDALGVPDLQGEAPIAGRRRRGKIDDAFSVNPYASLGRH